MRDGSDERLAAPIGGERIGCDPGSDERVMECSKGNCWDHGSTEVVGGRAVAVRTESSFPLGAAPATTAPAGVAATSGERGGDVIGDAAGDAAGDAVAVAVRGRTTARARSIGRTRSLMSGMVDFGTAAATVVDVAAAVSEPSAVGEVAVPTPGTRAGTVGAEGVVGAVTAPVVERGAGVVVTAVGAVVAGAAVVAMAGSVVRVTGVGAVAVAVAVAAVAGVLPPSPAGEPSAPRRIDARCQVPLFTTARISGELTASLVAVDGSFNTTAVPVLGGMR